jgi:hypothetical protein
VLVGYAPLRSSSQRTLCWSEVDSNSRSRLSRAARSAADQLGKPGEDGRQWSAALKRPMDVRVTYCATAVTEL